MLAVKLLTGQQMGKTFPIREGVSVIGRSPDCDIILPSTNVSKKHAKIERKGNLIILSDLHSTNGSFVNGVKIESSKIRPGDKVSFYDMILEVVQDGDSGGIVPYSGDDNSLALSNANMALAPHLEEEDVVQPYDPPVTVLKKKTNRYFETVVLPGIYKLPELLDFQWVIGGFFILLVVICTSLSVIPLIKILRSSIEESSRRNVHNIITEMTSENKDALYKRIYSSIDLDTVERKQGVDRAFITDIRGEIVVPSRYTGTTPNFKGFHSARKLAENKPYVYFLTNQTLVGIEPIKYYDTKKSIETIRYYSVVVYSADTRMLNANSTLSLFVQTLALSLIVALIIYFFVSRLISYPIRVLNRQIDQKLQTGEDTLNSSLIYAPLQKLYSNLNSAMSRVSSGDDSVQMVEYDRSREMKNIVELIGFPAIAIRANDGSIEGYNPGFEERTGVTNVIGTPVSQLNEQSLKLSFLDLIEQIQERPDDIVTNEIDFNGDPYELAMQAIHGSNGVAYYIISFIPMEIED